MMGGILEKTGAAERMAYSFIKKIGSGKEELALGITGWLVSIPVLRRFRNRNFAHRYVRQCPA